MEKKNHLFDESIEKKLNELKEDQFQEKKKAEKKSVFAIGLALTLTLSILLRYFL